MENMPPRLVVPEWFTISQGKWLETALIPAMTAGCGQARAGVNGAEDASSQSRTATTKSGRMQTAAMWSRCDNRPDRAALPPHTTGRFLSTIIATASRTGAFDYGHAPRIR